MSLSLEIRDVNNYLRFLEFELNEIEYDLFIRLPEYIVNNFFKFNERKITNLNLFMKNKCMRKFNNIITKIRIYDTYI